MGSRVRRQFLWIPFLLLGALAAVFAVGGVALADEEYDVELPDTMVRLDQDGKEVEGNVPNFKARVKGAGGYYGSCIQVSFENNTGQTLRVKVPIGLRLVPRDASVQTMYTAGGEVITVPPGNSEAQVKAFCGEMNDSAPGTSDVFDAGGLAGDELMQTLKNTNKHEAYDSDGQAATWKITDDLDISGNEAAQKLVSGGSVSGKKAAAAGGAAGGVAGAGAVLERRRKINGKDEIDEEPSEGPDSDSGAADKSEKGPEGGGDDRPDKDNIPPGYSGYTKTGELVIDGEIKTPVQKDEAGQPTDKEAEYGPEDKEGKGEAKTETEPEEETEADKGDKAETKKDKAKTLTDGYVHVTTVGNVQILINPKTKKIAIGNGTYIGGKDDKGYWVTGDGQVVACNPETGDVQVSAGQYSVQKEGTTYTVTDDNKVISYNKETGEFNVSDGHFTAKKEDTTYTVTKDNKVLIFNEDNKEFNVSDGHFTAKKEGTVYTATKDNKVLTFNEDNKEFKVSDGHFTAKKEGTVYTATKDSKVLTFNEDNKEFKVSDGHFTVKKEGTFYTATKDNKVLTFNEQNNDFKVSDAHYTLEGKDKVITFTKDKVKLTYDRNQQTGTVSRWGSKYGVNVTAGQKGQWGVGATYKGSVDGTPTTFEVSADKYQLPGSGETGFNARANMVQKDFGVTTEFAKDNQGKSWGVGVRIKDWDMAYQDTPQGKAYGVSYKKFFYIKEPDKKLFGYQKRF